MKAITYARVSTGKQAESGLSLDDQASRMHQEIERRGLELVETYVDAGRSGRTGKNRPALDAARAVDQAISKERQLTQGIEGPSLGIGR
jgi:DNA invertase Pin-like site-specific DNA recombinase